MSERRWWYGLSLLAVLVVGSWPYWVNLQYGPMGSDSADWVVRGATDRPDWSEWVFRSSHLAGYRPVAAISYSLNYLISGFEPASYRLLDIVLHVSVAFLIFVLYRRLAPGLPAWGGWVASALFLAHPLAEQAVPIMARRSYLLASLFSVSALIVIRDGLARSATRSRVAFGPPILGALLLACGLLSNETAFVTVAVIVALPFFVRGMRFDRVAAATAGIPLLACALVSVLRWLVVGGLGGYAEGAVFRGMDRTAWVYTELYAGSWWESIGIAPAWVGAVFVLVGAWSIVSAQRAAKPLARVASLLVLWLLVSPVPSLISGTWFLRQLYPALVPFCLLLGTLVSSAASAAWASGSARHKWVTGLQLAVPLLLVAGIVFQSPSIRGPSVKRMENWQERHQLLEDLHEALASIHEPAHVLLVLPYPRRQGRLSGPLPWIKRLPVVWTRAQLRNRNLAIEGFLFYERSRSAPDRTPAVQSLEGRPALTVPAGLPVQFGGLGPVSAEGSIRTMWLDDVPASGDLYVYLRAEGRGRLIPVR